MSEEMEIREEVDGIAVQANALAIVTPEDYQAASAWLTAVKAAQKRVTKLFGDMKAKAHAAWKSVVAEESAAMKPLDEAEGMVKRKMLAWQQAEEAKRLAEQRKLQAEADAAATRERERLEKAASKLKTPELREARLEEAAAVVAPMVTIPVATPVIKGQSTRKTWRARVVDVAIVPREYMVVNDQALQAFARATKGAVAVPGVQFREQSTLASSSR